MSTTVAKNGNGNGEHHAPPVISGAGAGALGDEEGQLIRMMRDFDPDKMRAFWEIRKDVLAHQRMQEAHEAELAYRAARAAMQADLPIVSRSADNPETHSKYAKFESIWEACCPIWTRHGFSVGFNAVTLPESGLIRVTCELMHKDGHTGVFTAPDCPPDNAGIRGSINKTMVQGNQATVTYIQRGLLCRALGIAMANEDNDGASNTRESRPQPHRTQTPGRQVDDDAPRGRPPVNWADRAFDRLNRQLSETKWMEALEAELKDAPSATEVRQLSLALKKLMDAAPVHVRDKVRGLLADRQKLFAELIGKAPDKASDKPSDAAPLSAEEQWGEDLVAQVEGVWDMNTLLLMANDPATQAAMKGYRRTHHKLWERVSNAFNSRKDFIAREAAR